MLLALGVWLGARAADQPEVAKAEITFSDDHVLTGSLRLLGSRPLTIAPLGQDRQQTLHLADILFLQHRTESATMEKPWTFKEAGRHEKLYLDGEYPLLNFLTEIQLVNGNVVRGHLIAAVFEVATDNGKEKVFLKRQIKGELTQKLGDIVYPTTIRFPEHQAVTAKRLSGRVDGVGKLRSVRAVDRERRMVVVAQVADQGFDFGNLLPGLYDLTILTDTHVLTGFPLPTPAATAGDNALQPGDEEAIRKAFPLADDFFKDRWILAVSGDRTCARTLNFHRRADYYAADKYTPGGFLWHLEVWTWHLPATEWKLDQRFIVVRHRQVGGEANRRLVIAPELTGVAPGVTVSIEQGEANHADWRFISDLF